MNHLNNFNNLNNFSDNTQGTDMKNAAPHSRIRRLYRKAQSGFTLIELAVVVVIIGALIAIVAPKMRGGSDEAKAQALYDFASAAAQNWRLANMKCGTSTDTATSSLLTTASTVNSLNFVINGTGANTAYSSCVSDAALASLRSKVQGTSGAFTVQGYGVTWSGGGNNTPVKVTFAYVPSNVALPLYRKYSSVASASAATADTVFNTANTTDTMIQYAATTSGSLIATFDILVN